MAPQNELTLRADIEHLGAEADGEPLRDQQQGPIFRRTSERRPS